MTSSRKVVEIFTHLFLEGVTSVPKMPPDPVEPAPLPGESGGLLPFGRKPVGAPIKGTIPANTGETIPPPVGFIGLGLLGSGMARHLLRFGFPLVVWDRNVSETSELKRLAELIDSHSSTPFATVTIAETPAGVASACERTFVHLPSAAEHARVYNRPDGGSILAGIRRAHNPQIVDCSASLHADEMESLSDAVYLRGGRFLSALVVGSTEQMILKRLIFLTGGYESDALDFATSATFAAMGGAAHYCGSVGGAVRTKQIVSLVKGSQVATYAEAFSLAEELGLDRSVLHRILTSAETRSPLLARTAPRMLEGNYRPPEVLFSETTQVKSLSSHSSFVFGPSHTCDDNCPHSSHNSTHTAFPPLHQTPCFVLQLEEFIHVLHATTGHSSPIHPPIQLPESPPNHPPIHPGINLQSTPPIRSSPTCSQKHRGSNRVRGAPVPPPVPPPMGSRAPRRPRTRVLLSLDGEMRISLR